ncbi:MAG: thioredoxin [Kiritimatiellae bacterium]|nr:thioredoxin [Kiritimatiellia bacterium]
MKSMLHAGLVCAIAAFFFSGCSPVTADSSDKKVAEASAGKAIELNEMDFKAQTAQGVALVDFWAPWCPPCRVQGPIIDRVAGEIGEKAKVAKLNVDNARETAQAFKVSSIPTLVLLKDGKEVKRFTGVTQADVLIKAINELL